MTRKSLLAGGLIIALSSSVVPVQAQTWQSYAANNDGAAGGEYWDNVSLDGTSCNIGFVASKTSGSACTNQFAAGWLPYAGPTMADNLRNGNAYAPFMFAAGTYRFRQGPGLGGQVAQGDQSFGYFIRDNGGLAIRTALPTTHLFDFNVTFTTAWGIFIDEVGPGLSYSDLSANPFFALFSSRPTGLSTAAGVTTVLAQDGDDFLAGYADVADGDGDFNDAIVLISAVPEPSAYVLLATGLVGICGLARRRRSV